MFEQATKLKLRFSSNQGLLTTEDLWDLPLQHASKASLDTIAISLNREIKQFEEESFVAKKQAANTLAQLKLDIVKHIIAVKLAEKEANENAAKTKAFNSKVLSILAQKEDEELLNKTPEELRALLKS